MKINKIFSALFSMAMCILLFFVIIFLNNSIGNNNPQSKNEEHEMQIEKNSEKDSEVINNNGDAIPIITPEPVKKTVSFLAAGDNIIHQSVMDDAAKRAVGNDKYDFKPIYSLLRDTISNADIAFINQEGPIAGKSMGYSGYPSFNAPSEAGEALLDVGFDIISIANNHMLDKGEIGYKNSINYWKEKNAFMIGGFESEEDFNTIRYYKYGDLKIAFLSYTYGTNGIYLPSTSTMWVPYYDISAVDKHSREARKNADVVIVSMHWGAEDSFAPNAKQKEYTDILVNNNVDVIIGSHPHVLEPVEWKVRPDGKKTLVAYSIGNFVSTMLYPRNMVGGMLSFDISYTDKSDVTIENPLLTPTVTFYSMNRDDIKVYKFSDFTKEQYQKHGCILNENISYGKLIDYVTNTISAEFLPEDFKKLADNN